MCSSFFTRSAEAAAKDELQKGLSAGQAEHPIMTEQAAHGTNGMLYRKHSPGVVLHVLKTVALRGFFHQDVLQKVHGLWGRRCMCRQLVLHLMHRKPGGCCTVSHSLGMA